MQEELKKSREVLEEMITGKKKEGKKPSIEELEEILNHSNIQLLPDGSIVSIRITDTEKATLSHAISLMKELERIEDGGVLPKKLEVEEVPHKKNTTSWWYNKAIDETALRLVKNASVERIEETIYRINWLSKNSFSKQDERGHYIKFYKDTLLSAIHKLATELNRVLTGVANP